MKIHSPKNSIIIFIMIFLIEVIDAYKITSLGTCICDSCSDCSNALSSNECNEIKLEKDIESYNESCIKNPARFNNKIFDCRGNKIKGSGIKETYGIYLEGKKITL